MSQSLPLISLPMHARENQEFKDFDPYNDPEGALRRFNQVANNVRSLKDGARKRLLLDSLKDATPLLMEFVKDQAEACVLYGDIETTELIKSGTPIEDMEISVASLLFVEDSGKSMMLSFWSSGSALGAPLDFFLHALDHAKKLVFYNSNFDLKVASSGDRQLISRWWRKTHDPYYILREEFGFDVVLKLDRLLKDNGIAPKTASGVQAVKMYKSGDYQALQEYNQRDVQALFELVGLESVSLSNGVRTRLIHV